MSILPRRVKWSGTVTLASANTNYDLRTLINAAIGTTVAEVPDSYRELNLQAYPGIDGVGGNSNDILVGDSQLSTSNIGYILQSAQSRLYRSNTSNGILGDIYVRSAGASQKILVDFVNC